MTLTANARRTLRRGTLRAASAVLGLTASAGFLLAKDFEEFPVWQAMEGLWYGDLSYYSGDGSYRIHPYNALFRIELDGKKFHQQNWMYYPPDSPSAAALSEGRAGPGEGVEFIVNNWGEAVDDDGTMKTVKIDHRFDFEGGERAIVVNDYVVVYSYHNARSGALQHLQMVNMGVPGMRVRTAQGFDPDEFVTDPETGETKANPDFTRPRSFSAFRETRVPVRDFDKHRAELRRKYNVTIVVRAGATPDAPSIVERIDRAADE